MKIGPSTIGAVVFTAVSIAAFGWMIQRPKVSGQAVGFAMPSSGGASSSTDSTSANDPQAEADLSHSSATESAAEKTTEKGENTPTNDSDAETSTSGGEESTKVVTETEKTAESSASATNTDTDTDSLANSNKALTADATATVATNSAGSTETSETESTAPVAAQSSEAPSSSDQANSTATASSGEQESSEATPEPEPATSPETQTEQPASSESTEQSSEATTASTSPAIQAVQPKSDNKANNTSASIYTAADNANGTVVILNGCDYKPEDDDNIVSPLHKGLPQEGWNTLSLQLPNLSASSSYKDLEAIMPDAAARIESGIAMAKEKSQTPVVLFAHGCGAQVALAWMEMKSSDSISAYISLGAGVMNVANDENHLHLPLDKIKFPQLDIYGSEDNESVLKTAPERLSYINRAANPASRQKKIEGADHNVTGKGKELSDVIVKWLNGLAFKK